MAEGNNAWVFDSLIGFLHGPIWNAPLQTFIEEKSLVFDPNDMPDENNVLYRKIHDEYKHLVDFKLGSFMEELQITPEQFEVACLAGKHSSSGLSFHHGLFQQIWAANDIKIFIRMMTQRNIELQLQALDMIERKRQAAQASASTDAPDEEPTTQGDDAQADPVEEQHIAGTADATGSAQATENAAAGGEEELDDVIQEDVKKLIAEEIEPSAEPTITEEEVADHMQRLNLFFDDNQKVDPDDIKTRQEYLRAQRDKIVALKRKVRTEQFARNVDTKSRPKSSRAAQRVLFSTPEISDDTKEGSMQVRRALAERLRNEVVNGNE